MYEGIPLISNFTAMLNTARIGGIIGIVCGLLLIKRGLKHDPSAVIDAPAEPVMGKADAAAVDKEQENEL